MPREKKQQLKKRPDGRYACRYKNEWFYSYDKDDCLKLREDFKKAEQRKRIMRYFVREYALNWFERYNPDATPSTKNGVKIHLQKLIDVIGDLPVSEIIPSDIKRVFSEKYAGLANSYIKSGKQVICSVFDAAVADGLLTTNPARDRTAKPHAGKVGGHRSITPQEREWINTLCTEHRAHGVAMAMLYAGIRPQEAKAIKIERDVDFVNDTLTVRETAHNDPQNVQKYAYTAQGKTDKANRQIPLLNPLKTALNGKHGYLITSAHGERVTKSTWRVVWNSYKAHMETAINGMPQRWYGRTKQHKAILAAGGTLPEWISFTVTPYDLRHSFCTMCRDMKPPIELHTVIRWMGHADATMVLKIYDDESGREKEEAERLKAAFRSQECSQTEK
jgi:integrase